MKENVAVLFGGCSDEYAVSLQSAGAVLAHMDPARWNAVPVGITRAGEWFYYSGDIEKIARDEWRADTEHCAACALSPDRARPGLTLAGGRRLRVDRVFPVMHGKNGEDGTVQGLIELAGLPLVGCGTLASALCMDKFRAHAVARAAGFRAPRDALVRSGEEGLAAARAIGLPVFVKPARGGSSFGVTCVRSEGEVAAAVARALAHDAEAVVEERVEGFEIGCAVMGGDAPVAGAVDEIELRGDVFDFEEKYALKTARIHCPARISEKDAVRARETALGLYRALDCRGFARVDLFFRKDGEIVFNEINTIPGFTAHSRFPQMMRAAGWSFSALVDRLIEQARPPREAPAAERMA